MTTDQYYLLIIVLLLVTGAVLSVVRPKQDPAFAHKQSQTLPWVPLLCYPVIMLALGFLPATAIFLFWLARKQEKSWSDTLTFCITVPTLIYGIFHFVLGKPLPLGIIVQFLEI